MRGYSYNLGLAFEGVAAAHADRPALRLADDSAVSYRALDRLANRIGRQLRAHGVMRRDVVALFNAKTPAGYATMLAALKIGAAYVNLDEENPPGRLEKILASCRPRLIAADAPLAPPIAELCRGLALPVLDVRSGGGDRSDDGSDAGGARLCPTWRRSPVAIPPT